MSTSPGSTVTGAGTASGTPDHPAAAACVASPTHAIVAPRRTTTPSAITSVGVTTRPRRNSGAICSLMLGLEPSSWVVCQGRADVRGSARWRSPCGARSRRARLDRGRHRVVRAGFQADGGRADVARLDAEHRGPAVVVDVGGRVGPLAPRLPHDGAAGAVLPLSLIH